MESKSSQFPWRKILAISLTAGLLISLPTIIFVLICLWLWRLLVGQLAKLLRPDLGSLMTLGSAPFATDLIFSPKPKIPLILTVSVRGHLRLSDFRAALTRLIDAKDEKNVPLHPELQQIVTTWLGLIFWKWDPQFHVDNHVNILEEFAKREKVRDADLLDIFNKLLEQKFNPNRSPWEFLLLYNYVSDSSADKDEPRTLVILRTHHCVGDGFSLLKLFLVDLSGEKLVVAKPVPYEMKVMTSEISLRRKIFKTIFFPIRVAYELMTTVVDAWDINEWHIPEWRLSRKIIGGVSPPLPLEYLKKIKNAHGTSFTSVPLAAFAGGIRNFMMDHGFKVPDGIHCLAALPFPGHPWKLTNHLTGAFIRLPLGLPTAAERLQAIEKNLVEIKSSTVPMTLFYLMNIGGLAPAIIGYIFFRNWLTTALNSNFPGPAIETKFVGLPIQDCGFAAGFGSGNSVIGLGSLSYNGNIRLTAGFDEAVFPVKIPFQRLMNCVVQELEILDRHVPLIPMSKSLNEDLSHKQKCSCCRIFKSESEQGLMRGCKKRLNSSRNASLQ